MKLDTEPRLNGVSATVMEWARKVAQAVNYVNGLFANGVLGVVSGGTGGTTAADARNGLAIGPVISFRNRARNPNFVVNQRAKAGSVVLAAGVYGHDGWKAGAAGCSYTFTPSGADIIITITAGSLVQPIEGNLIEGGDYVMSWFGTAQGKIGAGAFAASGVTASGVTPNANLSIEFGTGTLSRVQPEPGLVPTPYERRPISFEELLCRRYFQLIYAGIRFFATGAGQGASVQVNLPVVMRATPTVATFTAGSAANAAVFNYVGATARGFRVELSSSAAGDSFVVDAVTSASAEI